MDFARASQLLQLLPLPLAQTLRRALNAKSPEGSHLAGYYFFECLLKLAAAAQVSVYLQHDGKDERINGLLQAIARPSVGHWLGILRDVSGHLDARKDATLLPLAGLSERLKGKGPRPWATAFMKFAAQAHGKQENRTSVTLLDLFDAIVNYRNLELGHGGQRPASFYAEAAPLLIEAVSEGARELQPFGVLTLCVSRSASDRRTGKAERHYDQLRGDGVHLPFDDALCDADAGVEPGELVFCGRGVRVRLHPLVVYEVDDFERDRVGFLNKVNSRRGATGEIGVRQVEYLDYDSGARLESHNPVEELARLLTRVSGSPVVADQGQGDEATAPDDGQWLAGFRILGELGRGGMGVVYKAEQASLQRIVALKVLPPGVAADPIAVARFRREIAALGRCDHPNVVKVLAAGQEGERHYYAMEYVEGSDLAGVYGVLTRWKAESKGDYREGHLLEALSTASRGGAKPAEPAMDAKVPVVQQPLPQVSGGRDYYRRLAEIMSQAASGVAHLHEHGIVHRDLKPGNIMLTADGGRAVIMDLGLAQLQDRSMSLTQSGVKILGTLRYMPPEQLQHQMLEVTELADIYSLGATLYELAALAPIHDGDTEARLIQQVLQEEPKSPRDQNSAVPRDLETIIRVATSKLPAERYASAGAMERDLAAFARGEPIVARAPSALHYLKLFYSRNKPLVATLAAAVAVLLALASYFVYGLSESRAEALRQKEQADLQRAEAETQRRQAELRKSEALVEKRAAEEARTQAEGQRKIAQTEAERARTAEQSAKLNLARGIILHADSCFSAGMYDDAAKMYEEARVLLEANGLPALSAEGGLTGCNAYSPPVLIKLGMRTYGKLLALKPLGDGKRLLLGGEHGVVDWDLVQWRANRVFAGHDDYVHCMDVSSDGRYMLTGSADTTLRLWDFESGAQVATLYGHEQTVSGVFFLPGGKAAVSISADGKMRRWNVQTRQCEWSVSTDDEGTAAGALSPNGSMILLAGSNGWARIRSCESGAVLHEYLHKGESGVLRCCCWSPGGEEVYLGGRRGYLSRWKFRQQPQGERIAGTPGFVDAVSVTDDGTNLIVAANGYPMLVIELASGAAKFEVPEHIGGTQALAARGGRFWSVGLDARLKEWSLQDGARLRSLENHASPIRCVAASPDGSTGASCEEGNNVRIWELRTGRQLDEFKLTVNTVHTLCFTPDGKSLVLGLSDGGVHEYIIREKKLGWRTAISSNTKPVSKVCFSPDGKFFAFAGADQRVQVFTTEDRRHHAAFDAQRIEAGKTASFGGLQFSADSKYLFTAGGDGTLRALNLETRGAALYQQVLSQGITAMVVDHSTTFAYVGGSDGRLRRRHLIGEENLEVSTGVWPVRAMALPQDSRLLAVARANGEIAIYDTASMQQVRTLYSASDVGDLCFIPGTYTLISGNSSAELELWDANAQPESRSLAVPADRYCLRIVPLRDSRLAATICSDGFVRVNDLGTGQTLRQWQAADGALRDICVLDDTRIATAGEDRLVCVWESHTGRKLKTMAGHEWVVLTVAAVPGGNLVSADMSGRVIRWDPTTGDKLAEYKLPWQSSLPPVVSPDGALIAQAGGQGHLALLELKTGARERLLMGGATSGSGNQVRSMAFSPDGQWITTGHEWGTISVWEVQSRRHVRKFQAHHASTSIGWLEFTPDGFFILTCGSDKARRMFQFDSGREQFFWTLHPAVPLCTRMSQDRLWLLVCGDSGQAGLQDIGRVGQYRTLQARIPETLETLRNTPGDARAQARLGQWYAFRGIYGWAIDLMRQARAGGAEVDGVVLGQTLWRRALAYRDKSNLVDCLAEFESAHGRAKTDTDRRYLELCIEGVNRDLKRFDE